MTVVDSSSDLDVGATTDPLIAEEFQIFPPEKLNQQLARCRRRNLRRIARHRLNAKSR